MCTIYHYKKQQFEQKSKLSKISDIRENIAPFSNPHPMHLWEYSAPVFESAAAHCIFIAGSGSAPTSHGKWRQQNVSGGGNWQDHWNVQPLPSPKTTRLLFYCDFFWYSIIFTHFEIFNHDYDDTVNIPIDNFCSNFTHCQRQLMNA